MSEVDHKEVLDNDALDDLYSWIEAVPMSRVKRNIARDFSDGVLVAEIVHHYLPRVADVHNYVTASSTGQKRINWNTLNRKVFSKLNIKLNHDTLDQVVEAKPGAIEQILWDLRRKMTEYSNSNSQTCISSPVQQIKESGYGKLAKAIPTYQSSESKLSVNTPSRIRSQTKQASGRDLNNNKVSVSNLQRSPSSRAAFSVTGKANLPLSSRSSIIPISPLAFDNSKTAPSVSSARLGSQEGSSIVRISPSSGLSTETDLKQPIPEDSPANIPEGNLQSGPGQASVEPNNAPSAPSQFPLGLGPSHFPTAPSQIVYKGHKMVPIELLEIKDKEIRDVENVKKNLLTKIDRLEKLIVIKDQRLMDLGLEAHSIRSQLEQLTKAALGKEAVASSSSTAKATLASSKDERK